MNQAEQRGLLVLNHLEAGAIVNAQAAELLGISIRQVRRLRAAYRERGAAALAHGNRGRRPAHAIDWGVAAPVVELATSTDAGFNREHLTEMLAEHEGLVLSRPSVHRILAAAGVAPVRKRRAPRHRGRRDRLARAGMLLQIDGSRHDWLEGRLAGAANREDANLVLQRYLLRHNRRFSVPAADPVSAYLPWPKHRPYHEAFCFKFRRVVGNDNTVRFGKLVIDLPPRPHRTSAARLQVEVHQRFHGSVHVFHDGVALTSTLHGPLDLDHYRLDISGGRASSPPRLPRVTAAPHPSAARRPTLQPLTPGDASPPHHPGHNH